MNRSQAALVGVAVLAMGVVVVARRSRSTSRSQQPSNSSSSSATGQTRHEEQLRETHKENLTEDLEYVGTPVNNEDENEGGIIEYDYIIIGGGTAGCCLANRLSGEIVPNNQGLGPTRTNPPSVLLIEAGQSARTVLNSRVPAAFARLWGSENDWNFRTVPQEFASKTPVFFPRAKMLGGCTSSNAMVFQQGSYEDYNEWVEEGQPDSKQWGWKNFQPYFKRFENYTPHDNFPVDLSARGSGGPMQTGYFGWFSEPAKVFVDACRSMGIISNPDFNGYGGTLGVNKLMTYIRSDGLRSTAEMGYLTKDVLGRPNLTVITKTRVLGIKFDTSSTVPRAVGVVFAREKDRQRFRANARQEVILCAGAVQTPQILKLSGVGPEEEVKANGIPVVLDSPHVGMNLVDHPYLFARTLTVEHHGLSYLLRNSILDKVIPVAQLALAQGGPLTSNVCEAAAFVRSNDQVLFPHPEYECLEDMTAGFDSPDLELFAGPTSGERTGPTDCVGIAVVLLRPQSSGSITLKNADPWDSPNIDPRYLSTKNDVKVLTRGFKLALRLFRTRSYGEFIAKGGKDDDLLETKTDEELESIVKERVITLYHPMCTARMGKDKLHGVVDYNLKVHGVEGLRIVDASVFPSPVSGHTAAAALAVAERASEIIIKSYL